MLVPLEVTSKDTALEKGYAGDVFVFKTSMNSQFSITLFSLIPALAPSPTAIPAEGCSEVPPTDRSLKTQWEMVLLSHPVVVPPLIPNINLESPDSPSIITYRTELLEASVMMFKTAAASTAVLVIRINNAERVPSPPQKDRQECIFTFGQTMPISPN